MKWVYIYIPAVRGIEEAKNNKRRERRSRKKEERETAEKSI